MEEYLRKNFEVDAKRPSEEALMRWRSAVSVVKNPRRRFRMVADLAKRAEGEKKRLKLQVLHSIFFIISFLLFTITFLLYTLHITHHARTVHTSKRTGSDFLILFFGVRKFAWSLIMLQNYMLSSTNTRD